MILSQILGVGFGRFRHETSKKSKFKTAAAKTSTYVFDCDKAYTQNVHLDLENLLIKYN